MVEKRTLWINFNKYFAILLSKIFNHASDLRQGP